MVECPLMEVLTIAVIHSTHIPPVPSAGTIDATPTTARDGEVPDSITVYICSTCTGAVSGLGVLVGLLLISLTVSVIKMQDCEPYNIVTTVKPPHDDADYYEYHVPEQEASHYERIIN